MGEINLHFQPGKKPVVSSSAESKIKILTKAQIDIENMLATLDIFFREPESLPLVSPVIGQIEMVSKALDALQQQVEQAADCDDKH